MSFMPLRLATGRPLPGRVTADEVGAELLARYCHREHSSLFGALGALALVLWLYRHDGWASLAAALVALRLASLATNFMLVRRMQAHGFERPMPTWLRRAMAAGMAATGVTWAAMAWLIDLSTGNLTPREAIMLMLIMVTSVVMLVTTSTQRQYMLAFGTGTVGMLGWRILGDADGANALLLTSLVVLTGTLAVYGLRLSAQTRDAVVAELHSQQLARDLDEANRRLAQSLEEANRLARHDPLTGTLNRRALLERASEEHALMKRRGHAACLLLLDLDHFKQINDQFGHSVGDQALVAVAQACQTALRTEDWVCRWGGEEFLVVLPATAQDAGRDVAERLRQAVANITLDRPEGRPSLTVSIGLTTWPAELSFDRAVPLADQALYQAKAQGRNQTVVHTGAIGVPVPPEDQATEPGPPGAASTA